MSRKHGASQTPPAAKPVAVEARVLASHERENPERLSGQDLRDLAHRRGIARSEAARLTDEKLRLELHILTTRQYAEA